MILDMHFVYTCWSCGDAGWQITNHHCILCFVLRLRQEGPLQRVSMAMLKSKQNLGESSPARAASNTFNSNPHLE